MGNTDSPGWKEVSKGGVIRDAGNAKEYETGEWRSQRPVKDDDACIHCLLCWVFCPDNSIIVEDGKVTGIDLTHCKGCGICAKECPDKIKAIKMVEEKNL